jgi:hypothetical protein
MATKKTASKAGSNPIEALTRASMAELQLELKRRHRRATQLERKRSQLLEQLDAVEQELKAIGHHEPSPSTPQTARRSSGKVVTRRAARGGNTKTLLTHLEEVMTGQVLSVSEAADAVIANGYTTTSKTFRTIVNQTLLANDAFVKVERGRYTRNRK